MKVLGSLKGFGDGLGVPEKVWKGPGVPEKGLGLVWGGFRVCAPLEETKGSAEALEGPQGY